MTTVTWLVGLDEDVAELNAVAMVLEPDGAGGWNARELGRFDHLLTVEHDGHRLALHRDFKGVPLSQRSVGIADGDTRSADLLGQAAIGAIAVDFAGAE